jgi:hypothetical protein
VAAAATFGRLAASLRSPIPVSDREGASLPRHPAVTIEQQRPAEMRRVRSRTARLLAVAALAALSLAPSVVTGTRAADAPVMDAAALLQGHGRVGTWMALRVHLRNDGPAVVGELRLSAGAQGRTRFGTPVDLPTQSEKDYILYAQPPAFARSLDVTLVAGGQTVAKKSIPFTLHDNTQLIVGIVAEQPQRIVPAVNLAPGANNQAAAIVTLAPADLPDRVEAWAAIDRLIWQDVDTQISAAQLAALRGWLASGGRLVVVGGTSGPAVLAGLPDDVLPYRPTSTIDIAPSSLASLVGAIPATATDIPALAGTLTRGRALATSGDRVIAAEATYGLGAVTIVGFDPTAGWLGESRGTQDLWRRVVPPRTPTAAISDDSQLVSAVSQLPALALPPIGGLLVLLLGYIALIGPINYLVLRRLDRREWAWITMPVLILVFAAGAYGFGASLRGLDVILNEVAIVRGAPDATEGMAQVYLGVFSPSRGSYQLDIAGGALVSSTLVGELNGDTTTLDIVQGDPTKIRNLTVGFGSLRTVRAETASVVPRLHADLALVNGTLRGTIKNQSDQVLEKPAVVLGNSVVVLKDLAAGAEQTMSLPLRGGFVGDSLSNRILGQTFFGDPTLNTSGQQQALVRHSIIDQLTFDPSMGINGQLQTESPLLLAWGTRRVLDVRVSDQVPRRTGNVLFMIPLGMRIDGDVTFEGDLMRSSVVSAEGNMFNKDAFAINMGRGTLTVAYRPIAFGGALSARRLILAMNQGGGDTVGTDAARVVQPIDPQPCRGAPEDLPNCAKPGPPAKCDPSTQDCGALGFNVPDIEVFDASAGGRWMRLPTFSIGTAYELKDAGRFVDRASGAVLVRFVNDKVDGLGFGFQVRIDGTIK